MEIKITDKKIINILPVNARMLSLNLQNLIPTEKREIYTELGHNILTNKILGLNFYDKKRFNIGDELIVNGVNYTINQIEPGEDYNYYLIDSTFNKSANYLLPLVADTNKSAGNYLTNFCLYNTYLYCDKYPQYSNGNFLFLCYKFMNLSGYKKMETEIIQQSNFVEIIEPNKNFTVFVLEINNRFKDTVNQFINGQYNLFHKDVKDKILSFYDIRNNGGAETYLRTYIRIKDVLYNSKEEIARLEKKLDIRLPEGMCIESKPLTNEETLII